MAEFKARRPAPSAAPPAQPPGAAPTARTASPTPPPFGSARGQRIAYTVNLPPDTVEALDAAVGEETGMTTYGMVAVDAIRTTFEELLGELGRSNEQFFPHRRTGAGRLSGKQALVRKVFYVTFAEAGAIESARQALGGMEIGQLHRLAFSRYFTGR